MSASRLAARIRARGHLAVEIDWEIGGSAHDVRNDAVFLDLLRSIQSHEFDGVFASPPCKSYMVGFQPKIRSRGHVSAWAGVPSNWAAYVTVADRVTDLTAQLLEAAIAGGLAVICENPADRGDTRSPAWWKDFGRDHSPIWRQPRLAALLRNGSSLTHTPHCHWGSGRIFRIVFG